MKISSALCYRLDDQFTEDFQARARIVLAVGVRKHGMVGALGRSLPSSDRCIVPARGH